MKCTNCGKEIDNNSNFCEFCGAKQNIAENTPSGFVDLDLPSGTLRKDENEEDFYDYEKTVKKVVPDTNLGMFSMERPQNYLGKAIAGVILCWPFGLPGIINAAKVNSLWNQGRQEEAIAASKSAAKWSRSAIILGIIFYVIYTIYYVYVLVVSSSLIGRW